MKYLKPYKLFENKLDLFSYGNLDPIRDLFISLKDNGFDVSLGYCIFGEDKSDSLNITIMPIKRNYYDTNTRLFNISEILDDINFAKSYIEENYHFELVYETPSDNTLINNYNLIYKI